jgi:drug/metabolite transporter (DMT)-like permease
LPALIFIIVVATTPIWVACISAITNLEQLTPMRVLGVVGGFAAVVLVVLATQMHQVELSAPVDLVWVLAAFGIPLLYALYILYVSRSWPADLDNLQGAQGQGVVALISFFCIWIIGGESIREFMASIEFWPIAMVVGAEILGLILLFQIARSFGGNFVSQANYVSIVVGAIISVIFFGQPVSLGIIFGILLLLLSMWSSLRAIDNRG